MEKKKKEEKAPKLVPLIGCFGCGLQVAGCGGVQEASPAPPPCAYRNRGAASSFTGTCAVVKAHPPYQVDPLAIEVFDYPEEKGKVKQIVVKGQHCNVSLGQKGELRPYGCNTLLNSAGSRLTLDELLELPGA